MACNGSNCNCNGKCNDDFIYDESGFIVGAAGPLNGASMTGSFGPTEDEIERSIANFFGVSSDSISYKYAEDRILADLKAHLDSTYSQHYMTEDKGIECFDAWIALGDSTPTFRNTAIKYLWRYGKKNGSNKKDLMKALHYIFMCLYVDHYKDEK
jgi:hypothetical protein